MRQPASAFWFILAATLTASAKQPPQQGPDFTKAQVRVIASIEYVLTRAPDGARIIPGHGAVASKADCENTSTQ